MLRSSTFWVGVACGVAGGYLIRHYMAQRAE